MSASLIDSGQPNTYVFIPLLYVVWEDSVLTPSELHSIQGLIAQQEWLGPEDRQLLQRYLNPKHPPSPQEFKSWYHEIRSLRVEPSDSLAEIGVRLAHHLGNGFFKGLPSAALNSLQEIESVLGVISAESIYHFYPERRKTITEQQATESAFSVAAMQQLLDGDQQELINRVKRIISDPEFFYTDPTQLANYRARVLHWCQLLAEQGFGSYAYPAEFGGKEDLAGYFTIMETISYHDLSLVVKFGVQFGLWGMSVYLLGTEKHHQQYLKDIGTLELPGCFAMTETGHGSNVRGIETTATYNHVNRTFTIHTPHPQAQKEYIGNAALHGKMATVFAKLIIDGKDYGVSAFVVPLRDDKGRVLPGVTIEDCGRKLGLNGVDNGKIRFQQVIIPKDNLLDRFAQVDEAGKFASPIASDNRRFFTMLGALVGGRIGIPRSGLSAAKSGLTIAIRYSDQRTQFGPEGAAEVPILNYRTHQRRLMPLLAKAYALHFALKYVTQRYIQRQEDEMQEIEALAAGLKAYATWNTTHTLQECREACGGKGYLSENRIDALKADTDIYTTFEGDNTVLMQLVAKSRLTEFKQTFSNMNVFGFMNYAAQVAGTSITEMNPFTTRDTDEEHLLDFEFHLNAFRYREKDILTSAAKRLRRLIQEGMDSFDAFNVCQHHLVEVGQAYVERIILEQFQLQVQQTNDPHLQQTLTKLCQLFALHHFDEHKGWYLENGYMQGAKTKAIRKLLNQLCWEVRKDAVPLVDAFGIPEVCLAAPIAARVS
jgi:acyl-CoA oxidase